MKRKVPVCERGKAHMTIIGLIMNTISPRTYSTVTGKCAKRTHIHSHTFSHMYMLVNVHTF